jgi:hypothetical protein
MRKRIILLLLLVVLILNVIDAPAAVTNAALIKVALVQSGEPVTIKLPTQPGGFTLEVAATGQWGVHTDNSDYVFSGKWCGSCADSTIIVRPGPSGDMSVNAKCGLGQVRLTLKLAANAVDAVRKIVITAADLQTGLNPGQ